MGEPGDGGEYVGILACTPLSCTPRKSPITFDFHPNHNLTKGRRVSPASHEQPWRRSELCRPRRPAVPKASSRGRHGKAVQRCLCDLRLVSPAAWDFVSTFQFPESSSLPAFPSCLGGECGFTRELFMWGQCLNLPSFCGPAWSAFPELSGGADGAKQAISSLFLGQQGLRSAEAFSVMSGG